MNEEETKNKQLYSIGIISLDYNISSSFPKQISFLNDYEKLTKIQIDSHRKKNENDKIDILPLSLTEKKNYLLTDILYLQKKRMGSSTFSDDLGFSDDEGDLKPSSKTDTLKLFFSQKQEKLKSIKTPEIDLKEEFEIYNIIDQFEVKNVCSSLSEDNFNLKKNKIIKQFVFYYNKHIKHPVTIQRFIDQLAEHTNESGELLKKWIELEYNTTQIDILIRHALKAFEKYIDFLSSKGVTTDLFIVNNNQSELFEYYRKDIIDKLHECFLTISNFVATLQSDLQYFAYKMNIFLFYFVKELPFIKVKMLKHFKDTYTKKNIAVSDMELKKIFKIFTDAYVFELFVPRGNQQELKTKQCQKLPDLITRNLLQCSIFKVIKDNKTFQQNDQNKENELDSSLNDINKALSEHKRIIALKNDQNINKEKGKKKRERYIQNNPLYNIENFTDIKTYRQPHKGYRYFIKQFNELDF